MGLEGGLGRRVGHGEFPESLSEESECVLIASRDGWQGFWMKSSALISLGRGGYEGKDSRRHLYHSK